MSKIDRKQLHEWALMMEIILKAYGIWETIVAKGDFGETLEDKGCKEILNLLPKEVFTNRSTIEQFRLDEMSFEEAIGRLTAYEERIKSQDTLETNDQDKLLMASSNNKSYGKWRGKDFNKEGKDSMKWKNNPNARRASTSQRTKDKNKLRCYDCGEYGHYCEGLMHEMVKQQIQGTRRVISSMTTDRTFIALKSRFLSSSVCD
ncbi:hypothetical protein Tco_0331318 [Tanacetum coccineum]